MLTVGGGYAVKDPSALTPEEIEQFANMFRRLNTLAEAADKGTCNPRDEQ